jgi:hypothetical protein
VVTDRVVAEVAARRLAGRVGCLADAGARADVHLGGVPFLAQLATGRLRDVRVDVTVPWPQIEERVRRREVSLRAEDGLVVAATTATVAGRSLPVTVYAEPRLDGGTLRLAPVTVEVFGLRTPAGALSGRRLGSGVSRALPELPDGMRYTGVSAEPDGLRLAVAGSGVPLDGVGRAGGRAGGACETTR